MMKVVEIDKDRFLTSTFHDPSPHRFRPDEPKVSDRKVPIRYTCEKCNKEITFKTSDFQKHWNSKSTNLSAEDDGNFNEDADSTRSAMQFFLDFYCPHCEQATRFYCTGSPSGYWGEFAFEINKIFVLKPVTIGDIV